MIYFVLASALIFIPTSLTFVDMSIPKLAYLSVLGVVCAWRLRETPLLLPWGTFLGAVALSGIVVPNLGSYLSRFSQDVLGAVFFWYGFQAAPWTDRKVAALAIAALAIAAVLMVWRSASDNVNIVNLGGIWALAIPLGIYGGYFGYSVFAKTACAAGVGWGIWSLFVMKRRMDLFALVLGLGVGTLMTTRRRWLLVPALTLLAAFSMVIWERGITHSSDPRLEIWRNAAQVILDNPFLGVGRGNLLTALYPYSTYGGSLYYGFNGQIKGIVAFLHNDYLELWVEAGPVALVAYLFLLGLILRRLPKTPWEMALYASLITVVVRGLFHSVMFSPAEAAWFWIFAGIYWRLKHDENKQIDVLWLDGDVRYIQFSPLGRRDFLHPKAARFSLPTLSLGLPLSVQCRGSPSDKQKL